MQQSVLPLATVHSSALLLAQQVAAAAPLEVAMTAPTAAAFPATVAGVLMAAQPQQQQQECQV